MSYQIPLKVLMRYLFTLAIFSIFIITVPISDAYATEKAYNTAPIFAKISKSIGFSLPIDCQIGENCWVMNYVDFIPNDNKQSDPACLGRTYNGHRGTDFAILDEKTMKNGVNVITPLDGTVTKIRNGEPDQWSTQEQLDEIKRARKECGNAVLINHGNSVQTIYCHMKNNSITVKLNQAVKAGDKIGEVGLSGLTEFPHLHFGVLKGDEIIDPFTGRNNLKACDGSKKSLWKKEIGLTYQPFTIQSLGFSDEIPELKKLDRNSTPKQIISTNTKIFTFWATLFGVRENDLIILEIKDPNGKIFASNEIKQDKIRAKQFYYIGKDLKNKRLAEGAYTGHIKIMRENKNGKSISKDKIISILITK